VGSCASNLRFFCPTTVARCGGNLVHFGELWVDPITQKSKKLASLVLYRKADFSLFMYTSSLNQLSFVGDYYICISLSIIVFFKGFFIYSPPPVHVIYEPLTLR
jgi:hypothetical protein